jgi:hypothetical protein
MIEILEAEKKVLSCLIHPELIQTVVEETGISAKVVKDIIRNLWHYRFIKAVDKNNREILLVDADLLHKARFTMTAKGINAWQGN